MDFKESTKYLYSLGNEVEAMKLGLENIERLLAALGDPQNNYLKVQVAGTNGKGSVCVFLNAICISAGVKPGVFTSPHLISITERIKIDGHDISEDDFARHASHVRETSERLVSNGELETSPTFFEQVTAIALHAFSEARVQLAILETGLGGRLDATTAANAEIAAITRIDYDHQEYLGNTIEEIAAEKAAIINSGTQAVVIGIQTPKAESVIRKRLDEVFAGCADEERPEVFSPTEVKSYFEPKPFDPQILGLRGRHQIENSKTSILLAFCLQTHFSISEDAILNGLQLARHPGRLEYVGKYLFDGAHNIGGAIALSIFLATIPNKEKTPITIVFGAMAGKQAFDMMAIIFPWVDRIILTEPSNSRSLSYAELLDLMPDTISREHSFACDSVANALTIAETITPDDGIILVTGSLYLVGEVKKLLSSR